jgi:hypothetical protein
MLVQYPPGTGRQNSPSSQVLRGFSGLGVQAAPVPDVLASALAWVALSSSPGVPGALSEKALGGSFRLPSGVSGDTGVGVEHAVRANANATLLRNMTLVARLVRMGSP